MQYLLQARSPISIPNVANGRQSKRSKTGAHMRLTRYRSSDRNPMPKSCGSRVTRPLIGSIQNNPGFYELRIRFCMDLGLCMLRLRGSGQAPTLRHLTPSRRQLPRQHSRKKDLVQGSILLPAIPPHIIFMVAPIATPSQLESGYRPGLDVDC